MTNFPGVAKLYDTHVQKEWQRLDEHPMEREITIRLVQKYVDGHKLLDIGGGPGKLALLLADRGYDVDLVDLSHASVAFAKQMDTQHKLSSITVGNAVDLDRAPIYDGVLLLGPLYHLLEEEERMRAVQNAIRAAKPGGFILCSVVTIEAHLRDIAMRDPARITDQKDFYAKYVSNFNWRIFVADGLKLKDGRYERSPDVQAFHFRSPLVRPFFAKFSDAIIYEVRSAEGILGGGLDKDLGGHAEAWANLMDELNPEATSLSSADHAIVVLKKI